MTQTKAQYGKSPVQKAIPAVKWGMTLKKYNELSRMHTSIDRNLKRIYDKAKKRNAHA